MAAGVAWIVPVEYWLLIGWNVACLVYLTTVWMEIWPRSVHETARLAEYTDPTPAAADALALGAAVASLGAVAVILMSAHRSPGPGEIVRIVFALVSNQPRGQPRQLLRVRRLSNARRVRVSPVFPAGLRG